MSHATTHAFVLSLALALWSPSTNQTQYEHQPWGKATEIILVDFV